MAGGLLSDGKKLMGSRTDRINAAVDAAVNPTPNTQVKVVKPTLKLKPNIKPRVAPRSAAQEAKVRAGNKAVGDSISAARLKAKQEREAFIAADEAKYKRKGL